MKSALTAVYWEILYKNRLVFAVLGGALLIVVSLTWLSSPGHFGEDWRNGVRTVSILTFLISILLVFAPFTLMESSGGWRMSSTVTRWFALPMHTGYMVLLPAAAGALCMVALVGLWQLVLNQLAPGLDWRYLMAVLLAGFSAATALAWLVPRKPVQYWGAMALLFPAILIFAFGPQDQPNTMEFRHRMMVPLVIACIGLVGFSWWVAAKARCGVWPGELPLNVFSRLSRRERKRGFWSAATALFWSEARPNLRLLLLSWTALVLLLYVMISLQLRDARPELRDLAFSWRVLPMIGLGILPVLGVLWMAVWGTLAGGEPGALFRPRLSSFRCTLPVSSGMYAGQRLWMLLAGWIVVWAPLGWMSFHYSPDVLGIPEDTRAVMQSILVKFMAVGAFVLVGALPVFLTGRFEGFPNVLLSSIVLWAVLYGMLEGLKVDEAELPGWRWGLLGALLALKFGLALVALGVGLRQKHISWRFPSALTLVWVAAVAALLFVMPVWRMARPWDVLTIVLLIPLARPALCPLALALNRHGSD
jgi:hypothetical protein